jgi:hypothetical protein
MAGMLAGIFGSYWIVLRSVVGISVGVKYLVFLSETEFAIHATRTVTFFKPTWVNLTTDSKGFHQSMRLSRACLKADE